MLTIVTNIQHRLEVDPANIWVQCQVRQLLSLTAAVKVVHWRCNIEHSI